MLTSSSVMNSAPQQVSSAAQRRGSGSSFGASGTPANVTGRRGGPPPPHHPRVCVTGVGRSFAFPGRAPPRFRRVLSGGPPPAVPRPAATVALVRDGADGLEVYLMRRVR